MYEHYSSYYIYISLSLSARHVYRHVKTTHGHPEQGKFHDLRLDACLLLPIHFCPRQRRQSKLFVCHQATEGRRLRHGELLGSSRTRLPPPPYRLDLGRACLMTPVRFLKSGVSFVQFALIERPRPAFRLPCGLFSSPATIPEILLCHHCGHRHDTQHY